MEDTTLPSSSSNSKTRFTCEICNIRGFGDLQIHMNGRKHKELIRRGKRREKRLKNTNENTVCFNAKGNFDIQLQELIAKVQRTPEKSSQLETLCTDLQIALDDTFPSCIVLSFGSAVTGLAFENSDVDCFVYLPPQLMNSLMEECDHDFNLLQTRLVFCTKRRLLRNTRIFSQIIAVPKASVPIVKFLHVPTNTSCDVSFKNGFGVHNSGMIRYLIDSDDRLKPLMLFIKYWAKTYDLLGHGRFSSYAVTNLIIFYLQQIAPMILLPISYLQRDPRFTIMIDGWNCGYDYVTKLPKTGNKMSILKLLQGFYEFFGNFEFHQCVICTYSGTSYSVDYFNQYENLLPLYKTYVERIKEEDVRLMTSIKKEIYIQDPFEHCRNIASGMSSIKLKLFKDHCKLSFSTIEEAIKNNNFENVIEKLLTQQINVSSFNVNIKFKPVKDYKMADLMKKFFDKVLGGVLKCNHRMKLDEESAVNGENIHSLEYNCVSFYNVWFCRKKHQKVTRVTDALLKEIEITDNLVQVVYNNAKMKSPLFSNTLHVKIHRDRAKISFVYVNGNFSEYKQCVQFLRFKLQTMLPSFIKISTSSVSQDKISA